MSDALEGFRIDRLACGYSPATITMYCSRLKIFIEYVGDKEVEKAQPKELKMFLYYLREEYVPDRVNGDTSPWHRNHWTGLRSFFGWCEEELDIQRPDQNLPRPEYTSPETKPFSKQEAVKLVRAATTVYCEASDNKSAYSYKLPKAERNKSLLMVLLDTGIRVGELVR